MYHKKATAKLSRDDKTLHIPDEFRLDQNSPNPFNMKTTIQFSIPRRCIVKLVIYNLREELVSILHDGQLASGHYILKWEGMDSDGQRLKNGVHHQGINGPESLAIRQAAAEITFEKTHAERGDGWWGKAPLSEEDRVFERIQVWPSVLPK